jgi:hypothetical protein
MKNRCPTCRRVIYDRRPKRCGYCGAVLPAEMQLSEADISARDKRKAEAEKQREQRAKERDSETERQFNNSMRGLSHTPGL